MRIVSAAAVLALFVASPAFADWGSTQWGDSLDAVIAKASEKPKAIVPRDGDRVGNLNRLAVAPSVFGDIKVEVQFYFDASHRLAGVRLQPKPDDCAGIVLAADKVYGTPVLARTEAVGSVSIKRRVWRDEPHNIAASFAEATGSSLHFCHIFVQSPVAYDAEDPAV